MTARLYTTVYAANDLPTTEAEIVSKSLGTVNEWTELEYTVHEHGTGLLTGKINRHLTQAALLQQDRYVLVHSAAGVVGGAFLEEAPIDLSSAQGSGDEWMVWGGKGQVAILARGAMDATSDITGGHDPIDGYWDLDNQGPAAGDSNAHPIPMMKRALVEMLLNSPSGIDVVDHSGFDYDTDSASVAVPFLDGEAQGANVGDDGLSLLSRMDQLGGVTFVMSPLFKLDAYLTHGTDRSGAFGSATVRLEKGINVQTAIQRRVRGSVHVTHLIVGGAEYTYRTVVDPDWTAGDVVRYGFLAVPEASDPDQLDAAGLAHIERRKRQTDAWLLPLHDHGDDPANGIYEPAPDIADGHFWLGDTVSFHTGTGTYDANEETSPVASIKWTLLTGSEANGDYRVTVGVGSTFNWSASPANEGTTPGSQHRILLCDAAQSGVGAVVYGQPDEIEVIATNATNAFDGNDATYSAGTSSLNTAGTNAIRWSYTGVVIADTLTLKQALDASYGGAPAQKHAASGWVLEYTNEVDGVTGNPMNWLTAYTRAHATWQEEETVTFGPYAAQHWRLRDTNAAWGDAGGGGDAANGWVIHEIELGTTAESAVNPLNGTSNRARRCDSTEHVSAASAPTADHDADAGYPRLTIWHDTSTGKTYISTDSSAGAAVWTLFASLNAADIDVADAGGYFTGTDVEAALQEVGADLATGGEIDGNARIGVRKNSTGTTFERRRVNLIEGTGVTLTVADDSGNEEVDVTIAASGGGGGSLTVEEVDGTPSVSASTLVFPNGTLTDNGSGEVEYTPAGGGGGGSGAKLLPLDRAAYASIGSGDDFSGTTLDGGWSDIEATQTGLTTSRPEGVLRLISSSNPGATKFFGKKRAFSPAGDFQVSTKIIFTSTATAYHGGGLLVGSATPTDGGGGRTLAYLYGDNDIFKPSGPGIGDINIDTTPFWMARRLFPIWIAVRRVGTAVSTGLSQDGSEWIWSASTTTISFTVATIGLFVLGHTNSMTPYATFEWIATEG